MMFDREDALIIKISPHRVNELITSGHGMEFNFTKKRFKAKKSFQKWVLIPLEFAEEYENYFLEALSYAKEKVD